MKPKVYIETSVVSYLTAWPSRDVVTLGNQVATREWWREAAGMFELVVSSLVIEESAAGDPEAARTRLAALESVQVVSAGDDATHLHAEPALGDGNMKNRISDPIVDEVRRVRAEIAARHGNDVAAIIRHAQEFERASDRACVRYPPRRVDPAGDRRPSPPKAAAGAD